MNSTIWVAFITGLTAGGLSCLAVQGGLLSGAIAQRVEQDMLAHSKNLAKKHPKAHSRVHRPPAQVAIAQPILLFLAAKLVAYTLLGFLLGALGQTLYLSPLVRGILQLAIGIFMVGNGLRMLEIHPIFRYFNLEPPSALTRYIRRKSKSDDGLVTPLSLGALTVFIPCGVTQSIMALALGLGSPVLGAATMFAFVLGTTPLFFGVTYLATRLSALVESYFLKIVAAALIILGLVSVNTGLNLAGAPFSFDRLVSSYASEESPQQAAADGSMIINVKTYGYSPRRILATAGQALKVHFVTQDTRSCARALVIPALRLQNILPLTGDTIIDIPPQPKGTSLGFTCSMGMYTGVIQFQ